jgi:hypothetical protein
MLNLPLWALILGEKLANSAPLAINKLDWIGSWGSRCYPAFFLSCNIYLHKVVCGGNRKKNWSTDFYGFLWPLKSHPAVFSI